MSEATSSSLYGDRGRWSVPGLSIRREPTFHPQGISEGLNKTRALRKSETGFERLADSPNSKSATACDKLGGPSRRTRNQNQIVCSGGNMALSDIAGDWVTYVQKT